MEPAERLPDGSSELFGATIRNGEVYRAWHPSRREASEVVSFVGKRGGKGDLTITWDEAHHDVMIGHIQALMDRGIAFYKLSEAGNLRNPAISATR